METRFQFTLRGMLWATFWVAVSVTAWGIFIRNPETAGPEPFQIFCIAVGVTAPFLGAGALLGRPLKWIGFLTMTMAVCLAIIILSVMAMTAGRR